jgi:hypothetical protein
MICGLLTSTCAWCEEGASAVQQNMRDSDVVQWRGHCDLEDGRRFLTDGSLLLDSQYVPPGPIPEKSIAPQGAQRLLQSSTDHEFGLADLERKGDGHYVAPGPVQLNRKYSDFLRRLSLKSSLRFGAKGPNDPVLILDGKKVVGVMMPMKL